MIQDYMKEVKLLNYELGKKQKECADALEEINRLDKHLVIYEEADQKYNEQIRELRKKAGEEEDKMTSLLDELNERLVTNDKIKDAKINKLSD